MVDKKLPDWCVILQDKWSGETPEWREQLVHDLGITPQTVYRWMRGDNPPEGKRKLTVLEKYIPEISVALRKAFPSQYATAQDVILRAVAPTYARVHQAIARTDKDMLLPTVSGLVLFALVNHLDIDRQGLVALLGQLRSTHDDGVADYLLVNAWSAQGTGLWQEDQARRSYAVGTSSLSAVAVAEGRPAFYPRDRRSIACATDLYHVDQVESAAAYPVLRSAQIAGVLFIASTRKDYFTIQRREIIEQYALMLSLAFHDVDFYPRSKIHLHPTDEIQAFQEFEAYIETLQHDYPGEAREDLLKRVREHFYQERKDSR